MECAWKPNWKETRQHFLDWWKGKGLILGTGGSPQASHPHAKVPDPGPAPSIEIGYTDALSRARRNHYRLSRQSFPADALPVSNTDIGPGSLALLLGSEPGFSPETVWYKPCMHDDPHPEQRPPLRFDPENRWWKAHEATLKACAELGEGQYAVGCPDLIENVDTLASLRDSQRLLMDMIERPEWVTKTLAEINRAFFEVYDRIYEIIKLPGGGAVFGAFRIWGPGKTAKVQCDASAMFSPAMFERFVVPALAEQCEWLDYSMFHLDGEHCICHLNALLAIDALDAIEWTPSPKVPSGGDPAWYDMYRRILDAGKSVQAVGVKPEQVLPLLDIVGGKGMYIMTTFESEKHAEELVKQVEPYR
jgi:hypothetical protein